MAAYVTVSEAAEELGVTPEFLRASLRAQRCPIGWATQTSDHRWTYFVSRVKLEEYTGKKHGQEDTEKDRAQE